LVQQRGGGGGVVFTWVCSERNAGVCMYVKDG
jgi:hypothetical protein